MESLDYDGSGNKAPFSNWDLTTRTSSIDTERIANDHNIEQLHIVQKKESKSDRPIIPATMSEKLSFFRSYTSSLSKTQLIGTQQVQFNRFLWFHIINILCKSLPSAYVYTFLGSYVPDQHLFLSKMVPIAYGSNFAFVAAGFINLVTYTDMVAFLLDYVVNGILYKNPWNRCPPKPKNPRIPICYSVEDFSKILQNESLFFENGIYKSYNNVSYNVAPLVYYGRKYSELKRMYLYFVILWTIAALQYRQLFTRYLWRALHNVQIILNVIYVVSFIHITVTYIETNVRSLPIPDDDLSHILWEADLDILSESMTAPPILHLLTSRSATMVQIAHASSAMVISNSLYFIFRGLLAYRLKKYCESLLKIPIPLSEFNPNSFFYLWPIYFSAFRFGDLYTLLYFILTFTVEFLTIMISLQCLIETIVCEWKWAGRKLATSVLVVSGFLYVFTLHISKRFLLFVYSIAVATTFEVLILYCLYPLGRLVDDISFYQGISPTAFRILNLRIIKMYDMFKGFFKLLPMTYLSQMLPYYLEILYLMNIPFILGAVYVAIQYLYVDKKNLKCLFKPISEWGPKDRVTRQLRKLYDSRYYIGSQAPRSLSRYMIKKSSLESYKLDIMYDNYTRRSSLIVTDIHTEDEKKRK